ncbi:hypothetical protein OMK64_04540 [Cellulomonas fimi]|nr:hypothetical protein [Cellulomonas fimi]MDC7120798.1 hypothetical protein [Cellulomonas fimi]
MFITVLVMASLLALVVSSLGTIARAKQRQTATSLATQALERLRALPYDTVTQPDGSSVSAGIEFVVSAAGVQRFRPTSLLPGFDEPLVVNRPGGGWAGSGQVENQTVGNVTYKVATYVTKAPVTGAGQQAFTATALVTWSSGVTKGTRRVVEQSVLYSPAGCLSTAQSPFAAPCQSYFTAQAGQVLAGFTVTNPDDSTQPISGFGAERLELNLPSSSSTLLIEQTASANADAQTVSAAKVEGTTTTDLPGGSAAASVDSDPSSTPGQTQTTTTSGYTAAAVSRSGPAGRLSATIGGGSVGSAAAAIGAPASTCTGMSGTGLTTGPASALRPCAASSLTPGSQTSSITYSPLWGAGGDIAIASVGGTTVPGRSVAAQLTSSNPEACTSGTGPGLTGCSYGASTRRLGDVVLGSSAGASGVPAGFGAALVQVTDLVESARAEEGQGARVPSYARAGTLRVWTGTSYAVVDLGGFAAPPATGVPGAESWTIPPTTLSYPAGLGDVTLTYEGSVTVQRPVVDRTQSGATRSGNLLTDCKAAACTTKISGSGAVTSVLTVTVQRGGVEVGRFGVSSTLGGLVAQATYKVAANA